MQGLGDHTLRDVKTRAINTSSAEVVSELHEPDLPLAMGASARPAAASPASSSYYTEATRVPYLPCRDHSQARTMMQRLHQPCRHARRPLRQFHDCTGRHTRFPGTLGIGSDTPYFRLHVRDSRVDSTPDLKTSMLVFYKRTFENKFLTCPQECPGEAEDKLLSVKTIRVRYTHRMSGLNGGRD
ncbi:hypothetical protein IAQ61_010685 [Plenodomus lingam]|uniref:uncharacterized protein n=1 Tax=Leptosphaeria maculans TaxID=5022 RepID=UPI003324FB92|nr:hypothetical protein IAQ61_010685 [Plenodomus lingam]